MRKCVAIDLGEKIVLDYILFITIILTVACPSANGLVDLERDELLGLLKEQLALERETIASMDEQVRRTKNRIIRLLLHGIVLDSMKHIDMLETMIDLLTGSVVPETEKDELGKELNRHVQIEKDSLDRLEGVIRKTEDKGVRFLLQNIASDERRHHTVLDQIISTLAIGENITDMDWWDYLYRYANLST